MGFDANSILYGILNGQAVSHEDVIKTIETYVQRLMGPLSKREIEEIAYQYEIRYGGRTFVPSITLTRKKGEDSWFFKKKAELGPSQHAFEKRYYEYLLKEARLGQTASDEIIREAEKVLSLCADPDANEKKRGLVMGDVQSGKTSNYLALASLACDYGYKIVLILAGMTDSLRIQTQERVDEGLIGAVSSTISESQIKYIGVGLLGNGGHYAVPLTTEKTDFVAASCTSNDLSKPQILVVKKNKQILTAVKDWLKPGQTNVTSRNILIIDDECDNASVNVKGDDNPSTINALIRDIYNNFDCSTYIGYTATPFANIFINPDQIPGYDDLFPSDFLHRLRTNPDSPYFGIDKVFRDDRRHLRILNEEEEGFLARDHKKDAPFNAAPESLKKAICHFLLACATRTHRGHGDEFKHRSMMINISRFNDVQRLIADQVERFINVLKDRLEFYAGLSLERALQDAEIKRIFDVYNSDDIFARDTVAGRSDPINVLTPFDEIRPILLEEVKQIVVTIVNNRYKGDQRFNYKAYKDVGARVIAIGGFVLSRGLTLEGLMTSYYSRNSNAYDTLMQMCRWFGYRPGYEDLCTVWMSTLNVECFEAVVEALDNLDMQLEMMEVRGEPPQSFGLMIQESPDTLETNLLVTARNKSKSSVVVDRPLNFSGMAIDTSKLYVSSQANAINLKAVKELYARLTQNGQSISHDGNGRHMFFDVDNDVIADFISKLSIPLENKKFDPDNISEFVRKGEFYSSWDIVFATGGRESRSLGLPQFELGHDLKIDPVLRSFFYDPSEKIVRIAKNNNRLLDPGIFNAGLEDWQIEEAKELAKDETRHKRKKKTAGDPEPVASDYLGVRDRKPLLVILPIKLIQDEPPASDTSDYSDAKKDLIDQLGTNYLIGFGIGFAGREGKVILRYRLNKVKQQEYIKKYESQESEEIEDDQPV